MAGMNNPVERKVATNFYRRSAPRPQVRRTSSTSQKKSSSTPPCDRPPTPPRSPRPKGYQSRCWRGIFQNINEVNESWNVDMNKHSGEKSTSYIARSSLGRGRKCKFAKSAIETTFFDKGSLISSLYCCCEYCDVGPSSRRGTAYPVAASSAYPLKAARTAAPQYHVYEDSDPMDIDEVQVEQFEDMHLLSNEDYFASKN